MLQFLNNLFEFNEPDPIELLKSAMIANDSNKTLDLLNKPSTINTLRKSSVITLYKILKIALQSNQSEVVDFLLNPEFILEAIKDNCAVLSFCLEYQVDTELFFMMMASGYFELLHERAPNFVRNLLINTTHNGNLEVLALLLQLPEVLASVVDIGPIILEGAFKNKKPAIVERVLMIPEVLSYVRNNPAVALCDAIKANCSEAVSRFLKLPAVLAIVNVEHLHLAAHFGVDKVVTELLKIPAIVANIAANGNEALKIAIRAEASNVVNQLLQYPAVVQAIDADVLKCATQAIDIDALKLATRIYRDRENKKHKEQYQCEPNKQYERHIPFFYEFVECLTHSTIPNLPQAERKKLTPDILCRLFAAMSPSVAATRVSYDWELSALYAEYQSNHQQVVPRIVSVIDAMKKKGLPTDLAQLVLNHTDAVPTWGKQYQGKAILQGKSKFMQLNEKRKVDTQQAEQFVKDMFESDNTAQSMAPR